MKKKAVVSLGHEALGYTTTEQWDAVKKTAKALADLAEADYQLTITHSNGPQVSMIHKAMAELRRVNPDYTPVPMCVCSAMSQGYVGYDIQNSLRSEFLSRGISTPVSAILTQVTVDPYDDAFYEPNKIIGRFMTKEDADAEIAKGNYVDLTLYVNDPDFAAFVASQGDRYNAENFSVTPPATAAFWLGTPTLLRMP